MTCRPLLLLVLWAFAPVGARAQIRPADCALFLDFSGEDEGLRLKHGAKVSEQPFGRALEFTTHLQFAEAAFSQKLSGAEAVTVGGWFFPRRVGEQYFLSRGTTETGALGERYFRSAERWVNFVLGTDERGFLLGTIDGNGVMPFPYVTVNEVAFDTWNQLIVVKSARGVHEFFLNGTLVHSSSSSAARARPFIDTDAGEPVRLAMPLGGLVGEVWVLARAVTTEEVKRDFLAKRDRYRPASPGEPVLLREMNAHPAARLWKEPVSTKSWPGLRARIAEAALKTLGTAPAEKVPLDPQMISEEDCGSYLRRKVSLQVQAGDRMPAYLLIPKKRPRSLPAIICFYGTTSGAGKETTVGLSGRLPGTPPDRDNAFAIDLAEAGFVAFAADYLRDGERLRPGERPYDTTRFYSQFPEWSIHGKDAWDTSRAIDYLQTLDFVDGTRIGMTGHSYGGHSTIFTTAIEPRIKAAVANGPVSDFLHHGMHWAADRGGGSSQSMPSLRPFVLDHTLPLPITFYEWTALIAPRPLLVGQAAGERRPHEEENYAAVRHVYDALGHGARIRYHWYAGDHDYPAEARAAMVAWFRRWLMADEE